MVCYSMLVGFHELFTGYEMEIGIYELFTSYEMEVETHVHVKIENQLGFSNYKLHAITRVQKL